MAREEGARREELLGGMGERERQVFMAEIALQAERFDEVVEYMKKIARMDIELTPDERNLLSIGYKNVIGERKASCRILCSLEQKEAAKGNEQNVRTIGEYRKRVVDELTRICNDILSIIAIHILPSSTTGESIVFFYKLKGDYYRYLAELKTGNERKDVADQSRKAYQAATSTSMTDLPPSHPLRLGLALNFSVFYYEILNSVDRACHLAEQAFQEAVKELNFLDESTYKNSAVILQLIRDNITLWSSDLSDGGDIPRDTQTMSDWFRKLAVARVIPKMFLTMKGVCRCTE